MGLSIRWTFPIAFPTLVCILSALTYAEDSNNVIFLGTNSDSNLSKTGTGRIEVYASLTLGY